MTTICITTGNVSLRAQTLDTPTADAILAQLPLQSRVRCWGDEIYFEVPVSATLEIDARDVVTAGEFAFWVEGSCIAIGFGPTPVSRGDEIRLAARTNIWARTRDDVTQLRAITAGDTVHVKIAE